MQPTTTARVASFSSATLLTRTSAAAVRRPLKLHVPGWRALRWVAEAPDSWLNRNRALLVR